MPTLGITAAIIAGGASRRMHGRDKPLLILNGKPIIAHIIGRVEKDVDTIVINVNHSQDRYAAFPYNVIEDIDQQLSGPLHGILSVLNNVQTEFLLVLPGDVPIFPDDLAKRLSQNLQTNQTQVCVASTGPQLEPMFAMCRTDIKDAIQQYLTNNRRRVDQCWMSISHSIEKFNCREFDFYNINTPENLEYVERHLLEL